MYLNRWEIVMKRPSGFVPIPFNLVGKFLIASGFMGLTSVLIPEVTHWYSLPPIVGLCSLAALVVGPYLILAIPKEPYE
jgi:hypothetical protein